MSIVFCNDFHRPCAYLTMALQFLSTVAIALPCAIIVSASPDPLFSHSSRQESSTHQYHHQVLPYISYAASQSIIRTSSASTEGPKDTLHNQLPLLATDFLGKKEKASIPFLLSRLLPSRYPSKTYRETSATHTKAHTGVNTLNLVRKGLSFDECNSSSDCIGSRLCFEPSGVEAQGCPPDVPCLCIPENQADLDCFTNSNCANGELCTVDRQGALPFPFCASLAVVESRTDFEEAGTGLNFFECDSKSDCRGSRFCVDDSNSFCEPSASCVCLPGKDLRCVTDNDCDLGELCEKFRSREFVCVSAIALFESSESNPKFSPDPSPEVPPTPTLDVSPELPPTPSLNASPLSSPSTSQSLFPAASLSPSPSRSSSSTPAASPTPSPARPSSSTLTASPSPSPTTSSPSTPLPCPSPSPVSPSQPSPSASPSSPSAPLPPSLSASPAPTASISFEASPDTTEDGICIDAKALRHFTSDQLVFQKHARAIVLCDKNESCTTPGHMVVYRGAAMMMRSYCDVVGCEKRVMEVNSPRYRRGLRVMSRTEGLEYTAFAARYGTRGEEVVMQVAVRVGL